MQNDIQTDVLLYHKPGELPYFQGYHYLGDGECGRLSNGFFLNLFENPLYAFAVWQKRFPFVRTLSGRPMGCIEKVAAEKSREQRRNQANEENEDCESGTGGGAVYRRIVYRQ